MLVVQFINRSVSLITTVCFLVAYGTLNVAWMLPVYCLVACLPYRFAIEKYFFKAKIIGLRFSQEQFYEQQQNESGKFVRVVINKKGRKYWITDYRQLGLASQTCRRCP